MISAIGGCYGQEAGRSRAVMPVGDAAVSGSGGSLLSASRADRRITRSHCGSDACVLKGCYLWGLRRALIERRALRGPRCTIGELGDCGPKSTSTADPRRERLPEAP
jgi:hypothetical protein